MQFRGPTSDQILQVGTQCNWQSLFLSSGLFSCTGIVVFICQEIGDRHRLLDIGNMSGSDFQTTGPRSRSKSPSSTIKALTALKSLHDTPVASPPVRTVSPERREWIRKESEDLLTKNLLWREKTKERMYEQRLQHERLISTVRDERIGRWVMKTKNSPFAVNLVAEDERITEENNIRTREEQERRRMIETRKERAKNEIVLKALSEFSDLEALRKEKRAILEEEQRLRALLALEKVLTIPVVLNPLNSR